MIRVGIESSFLDRPHSGIRTYVEELTCRIPQLLGDDEILLLRPENRPTEKQYWIDSPRLDRFAWEAVGVARSASRERIDLLHIPHLSMAAVNPAPIVVTIHDVIPYSFSEYRASAAMRAFLAFVKLRVSSARIVIVPSEYVADEVERILGIDRERIRVIPMGVDASLLDIGALKLANAAERPFVDRPYVFNIAGFDVRKNLPVLLEAFAKFRDSGKKNWKLIIAGAPHSQNQRVFPSIEPLVERFGLERSVELPGWVSTEERFALYRDASMYVTPSLAEGFGLTCLEAMASGVPTIGSNRGSLPEVIGDGGMSVEPDADSVSGAMSSIADNVHLARTLQTRGWARASEFSWDRTASETAEVYREVAAD